MQGAEYIQGYFYPADQHEPGRPGHLPARPGGRPVDPGFGVGGEAPDHGLPPVIPLPPGEAGQLPDWPPGSIWPPLPPDVSGKVLILAAVAAPGHGSRAHWVVVDTNLIPEHGRPVDPGYGVDQGAEAGQAPQYPDQGGPGPYPDQGLPAGPTRQPRPAQRPAMPAHLAGPGQPAPRR
jgi:hypothetical protein